jgi:hypothetical protein
MCILHVIIYRILAIMKAETEIIASMMASKIWQASMILYVDTFKIDDKVLSVMS